MTRGRKLAVTAASAFAATAATAYAGLTFTGADGAGDPYFPKMGNTGYDVQHYDVRLVYRRSGEAEEKTSIDAVADTDSGAPVPGPPLGQFDLDFRGPEITRLDVDGAPATFIRSSQELVVTPATPILDSAPFTVKVTYDGRPEHVHNPDGSYDGWTPTQDGVVALGEPQETPTWVPVNDHPTDEATWDVKISAPKGDLGISNGALVDKHRAGKRTVTRWTQDVPMPSYLALAAIGRFRVDRGQIDGLPYLGAVDRTYGKKTLRGLHKRTETAYDLLTDIAGPYPFHAIGGLIDPSDLGFAMETTARPYYPDTATQQVIIHELAHQWYGDSVAVDRWKEIWLNEGFATYMEWLYQERNGGESAADRFQRVYENTPANDSLWDPPPANPGGPANLFAGSVYDRGAMALEVLRLEIGDDDFFQVLRDWAQDNAGGNASTQDLYDLIEATTGSPRPDSFDEWLYSPGKPGLP